MRPDIEILKRLAIYGSPTARAVALTILDEMSGGRLFERLKKFEADQDEITQDNI